MLLGAGILLVISKRDVATIGVVDIEAAPDPVKCKAFDAAKVNSTVVGEPCSQVCGTPNVGGDQTKCAECETACGALNCGCFGTNSDPALCDKHGALTTAGCTNPRAAGGAAEDDNEDNDNDSGGGGSSGGNGMNAQEYTKATTPAQRKAANEKIEALSKVARAYRGCLDYTPSNWV